MRKIYLFIVSLFLVVLDARSQVLIKTFEVKLENQPIGELIKQIEKQSNYHFYYEASLFDSLKITLSLKDASINNVLDKAFHGSDFYYSIYNQAIFLTKTVKFTNILPSQYSGEEKKILEENIPNYQHSVTTIKPILATSENKLHTIGSNINSNKSVATLAGFIRDFNTGVPVSGVAVSVDDFGIKAITDASGFYSLTLAKGRYELNIKAIGYKDAKRQILLQNDGKLDIIIEEQLLALKEVVISSDKVSNIRSNQMGLDRLDIKTIKQVPTVFGETDILRVVLTLPGVKSVGESSTGFNVRGGSVDQNLILYNDAVIYNPSHFFGFFSAFNPEVVKDIQLYKSNIPARYGGRLSSVLELTGREGNKIDFTGNAGIGLITSRLNLEGPIIKNKTSFILGGRTTYSNWIMDLLPETAGYKGARANFYDVNLNISHQQNEKNSFYAIAYLSNDKSNLATDTTFQYRNQNIGLRWKHIYNNKLYSVISGGHDKYSYDNYSNYKEDVDYRLKFSIQQTNFKANFHYFPNPKLNVDFGASSIYYVNKPGSLEPYNNQSLVIADVLPQEQALESAVFVEQNYDVTDAISISTGLRYSFYNSLGPANVNIYADGLNKSDDNITSVENYGDGKSIKTYHGPEYRLGARFVLTPTFSLKAGYNTQRQYIHMLSNTTSMSPTDVWKLSDMNITPQNGNQVSVGLYKNFKSNTIETSIEGYYKRISNFLDYKSGAVLILNHKIEQDVLPTQGKAYGIEFLVKKLTGKLNGWASYTYSRTMLKTEDSSGSNSINEGAYYPANYDKPHDFTLIGNYRLSHRLSFSLNLTYSTGRPITLPVGKYYYLGGQRLLYSDRNQYRIPDYFRSDISINVLGNHRKKQFAHNSWTFGVYNLTGRKNVFSSFFASENRIINGYKMSIFGTAIPFVNYNIRFK
jgi:hypothetical protein